MGRGPEGEQIAYDKDGKAIKSDGRVELVGYQAYRAELRERAGLPPEQKAKSKPAQASGLEAINQLASILGQRGLA